MQARRRVVRVAGKRPSASSAGTIPDGEAEGQMAHRRAREPTPRVARQIRAQGRARRQPPQSGGVDGERAADVERIDDARQGRREQRARRRRILRQVELVRPPRRPAPAGRQVAAHERHARALGQRRIAGQRRGHVAERTERDNARLRRQRRDPRRGVVLLDDLDAHAGRGDEDGARTRRRRRRAYYPRPRRFPGARRWVRRAARRWRSRRRRRRPTSRARRRCRSRRAATRSCLRRRRWRAPAAGRARPSCTASGDRATSSSPSPAAWPRCPTARPTTRHHDCRRAAASS